MMIHYSILFVFLAFPLLTLASDFDQEKLLRSSPSERLFRSAKVQQLWEKAERMHLPSVSMADLYMDLKEHDHHTMEVKKLEAEGTDEDGVKRGLLRDQFIGIIHKYGIGSFDRELADDYELNSKKRRFQDPKLNKLWSDIVAQGKFTSQEFDNLYLEFKHHEDKLVELRNLHEDLSKLKDVSRNSVEQFDDERMKIKQEEMRNLHSEVDESYQRLRLVMRKTNDHSSVPFREPRVMELWEILEKGDFSEEEKSSFMEELRHFEKRIEKHRHLKDQLRNSAEKIDYHGGKDEIPTERLIAHRRLQDKLGDMTSKIEKFFSTLKLRLHGGVLHHKEL